MKRVAALGTLLLLAAAAVFLFVSCQHDPNVGTGPPLATVIQVPFKTGHLGIHNPLAARKRGRTQAELRDVQPLKGLRSFGVSSIEEYVPWFWLEPEKGKLNWRMFDHHFDGVKAAGMQLALSPFGHFVPDWVTKEEGFQGFVCREHKQETTFPSIFAPSTLRYYDRYYRILAEHYKEVCSVYPAGTSDYGELGYPHGVDEWNDHHMHEGWWIHDPYAVASYRQFLEEKFGAIGHLNQKWGTQHISFEAVRYPTDAQNRLAWLDFMQWYRDAQLQFMVDLVALAKKHFPDVPMEVKLGQPNEKPIHGIDVAGLFKAGREQGFSVRSTAAFVPTHVYRGISKERYSISFFLGIRQASAAEFYGLPFITEEFAGMPKQMSLTRIFNDASLGVDEVFLGPPTLMSAMDYYQRFGAFIVGQHATTRTAFYYPLTDHLLQPEQPLPSGVFNASNTLRERMNYGIVDDQMLVEGALDDYQYLVFFDLGVMPSRVLDVIEDWLTRGGILVHGFAGERIDVLERAGAEDRELFGLASAEGGAWRGTRVRTLRLGKGGVIAQRPASDASFYELVVQAVHHADELLAEAVTEPEIDLAKDGVFASYFDDRVLLYNSTGRQVTKEFRALPKHFPVLSTEEVFSVVLPPRSIQQVLLNEAKGGSVVDRPLTVNSTGEEAPSEPDTVEDVRERMREKMSRFQRRMPVWVSMGGNPNRVRPLMESFQKLMETGKIAEAEQKIDEALEIVGK